MQLGGSAGMRICGYAARRYTDIRHVALWFAVIGHSAVAVFTSDADRHRVPVSWFY